MERQFAAAYNRKDAMAAHREHRSRDAERHGRSAISLLNVVAPADASIGFLSSGRHYFVTMTQLVDML